MAKKYLETISFKNGNLVIRDAEAQAAISNLQSNVSTISETVANHSTHLAAVDERIAENTADIDALERLTENHEARLDTAEDDIARLNADMSDAKAALFDIDGRLDVVETSVSGIENRLSDAEDDISTLKTRVTENENNIDTLQHDTALLQVDVGELQEWKEDTDERLDDMDDRITASTYEAGEGIYFGRGDSHTNINVEDELLAEIHGASDGVRKLFADLGTDFVDYQAYFNGDYVLHDGYLYRFDNPTPLAGTWDAIGGAFTMVTTSAELKRIAGQSGGDSSVVIIEFTTGTYPAEMTYTTIKGYVDDGKTVLLYNTGTTYIYQLAQIDTNNSRAVFTHLETFIATRKSSNMKVVVTDNNVVLANDELITLPASTVQDAGKVLKVDSAGAWDLGEDEKGTELRSEAPFTIEIINGTYNTTTHRIAAIAIDVNGTRYTSASAFDAAIREMFATSSNHSIIMKVSENFTTAAGTTYDVPVLINGETAFSFYRPHEFWATEKTQLVRLNISTPLKIYTNPQTTEPEPYYTYYSTLTLGTGLEVDSNNKLNVTASGGTTVKDDNGNDLQTVTPGTGISISSAGVITATSGADIIEEGTGSLVINGEYDADNEKVIATSIYFNNQEVSSWNLNGYLNTFLDSATEKTVIARFNLTNVTAFPFTAPELVNVVLSYDPDTIVLTIHDWGSISAPQALVGPVYYNNSWLTPAQFFQDSTHTNPDSYTRTLDNLHIGDGLKVMTDTTFAHKLSVKPGSGLELESDGGVGVNVGTGLYIDPNGQLSANGLTYTDVSNSVTFNSNLGTLSYKKVLNYGHFVQFAVAFIPGAQILGTAGQATDILNGMPTTTMPVIVPMQANRTAGSVPATLQSLGTLDFYGAYDVGLNYNSQTITVSGFYFV